MASVRRAGGLRSVFAAVAAYGLVALPSPLGAGVIGAASEANGPREYLDEETGATVFFVDRPLIFARERTTFYGAVVRGWPVHPRNPDAPPELPSPAPRDYLSLVAAGVDRSGKYTYLLIGYSWFVGLPQPDEKVCRDHEHLVLQLDDRRIELAPFDGSARDAGISKPIHAPWKDAKPAVFTIDLATLGLIAASAHPVLYCGAGTAPLKYELVGDRLRALRELVRNLSE